MNKKQALGAAAALATATGLALAGANLAQADTLSSTTLSSGYSQGSVAGQGPQNGDAAPSKPMRSDETLLTGETATKVTAAAKAKEPTATIERVETDSDGVYEAHMVRADGTHIIVQIDANFTVTNVQEGGAGGPGGGRGQGAQTGAPGGTQGSTSGTTGSTGSSGSSTGSSAG